MPAVAPGDVLGASNPILDTFTATTAGVLADPFELAFQIWDVRNEDVPAQLYPAVLGDRAPVDLVLDKLGTGHFAAAWTVPNAQPTGRYEIRWFLTQEDGGPERTWRRYFDVLPLVPGGIAEGYALVADMREEGVPVTTKNRRILESIDRASRLIERWTGRVFGPNYKQVKIDGLLAHLLPLDEPICAIESIAFDDDQVPLDPETYRVYNRHLTQGLLDPDDRDSPKIEWVSRQLRGVVTDVYPVYPLIASYRDVRSPRTTTAQEIVLTGVFGFTDPEPRGCPVGVVPSPIRRATILLALRLLPLAVTESDQAQDAQMGHKIKRMKTREQEVEYFGSGSSGEASDKVAPFTGDDEIDTILLTYMKPLSGTGV